MTLIEPYPGSPMSEKDMALHYEASKCDAVGLVGSEVRQLIGELRHSRKSLETQAAEIARLRGLLTEAEGALVEAIIGVGDDYMTSEAHHPDYVLIPVAKFDQLVAAEEALKRGTTLAKLRAEKEDG